MNNLYFLPDMPGVSIALWVVASMIFLFLAREPVHKMIQACSEATAGGLRKLAEWMKQAAHSMREKDRKVLLESGVAKIQGEKKKSEGKLGNASFVDRAPAEVVEQEKARLEEWNAKLAQLEEMLSALS